MTMTLTYDHRIIQGAESGRFLGLVEERLQGEHGFYEAGLRGARRRARRRPRCVPLRRRPRRPRGGSPVGGVPGGEEILAGGAGRDDILVGRVRSHGHLAARLDPLGASPRETPDSTPKRSG